VQSRTLARLVIATAISAAAMTVWANPATATPPAQPVCKTAVTHLIGRPDSDTRGNTWALDGTPTAPMTRTTTICEQPPVVLQTSGDVAATVEAKSTYLATVVDDGTFVTVAGAKSPRAGAALGAGVTGYLHGTFSATFNAKPDFKMYQGAYDGKTYSGTAPSTTGDWVKNLWGGNDFAPVKDLIGWTWSYWTCSTDKTKALEVWVDAESTDSGKALTAGDITGKKCPTTAPTTTAPTTPASGGAGGGATSTTAAANAAGLPVTGFPVKLAGFLAAALILIGAAMYVAARRRRAEFKA
jgi:hypothetical protein